jgi:hypothetical protein
MLKIAASNAGSSPDYSAESAHKKRVAFRSISGFDRDPFATPSVGRQEASMKTPLAVILLFCWSSISAQILPEYSGAWYNRDQAGHGLSIEVISDERTIAYWYTYDFAGTPMWFLFDGVNVDNRVEATVYLFHNMFWGHFDPTFLNRQEVGTATIEFSGCDQAELTYSLGYFGAGEIPLERLTHIAGMECNMVGELAGDWLASIYSVGEEFWVETTVHADGTFILYDAMACIWTGRITVVDDANALLAATFGTDTCGWKVPTFEMHGIYVEPFEVCNSSGQCQIHDAAMGFEGYAIVHSGDGDPEAVKVNLRFVRPIE